LILLNCVKTKLSVIALPQYSVYPEVGLESFSIIVNVADFLGYYVVATENQPGGGQLNKFYSL
jgi:hypothetical protein